MQLNVIVNFGGPRNLNEIEDFLKALLCDRDVIRTGFPSWLHNLLFSRIAKKRARTIVKDYELIGGSSPIFEDTEAIAHTISATRSQKVLTFHRYLPSTHEAFIQTIRNSECDRLTIFPMFPQYSYATTGSIARFFSKRFGISAMNKMGWVRSYFSHPAYIQCMQKCIAEYLQEQNLNEKETILFFSPHGLPQEFISRGDRYQTECQASFQKIASFFPNALSVLAYQSKFGKGEWLRPYTNELCEQVASWGKGYRNGVFIPLSFTSDHIETLFEVEYQYLPIVRAKGFHAYRCPALNRRKDWINAIAQIMNDSTLCNTQSLIPP
ncbi:MAG TPA: ferrochelatase [Rhabdochlamydiaceae bacterium]|nr:ferrochelatase [Rhabdochlamydiaceae bacterium]